MCLAKSNKLIYFSLLGISISAHTFEPIIFYDASGMFWASLSVSVANGDSVNIFFTNDWCLA